jgi:uncharacterized protein
MQYRSFGRSGIKVSILGYGAMRLPALPDGKVDLEQSVPMLHRGLDQGINYIDTAYVYINGTSEVAVGQAIKGYDRSKLFLATKIPVDSEESANPGVWRKKLEESLKRFDTPYIDFILFHGLRWNVFEEYVCKPCMTLDAARSAQAEGLVKHVSFSSHDTAENVMRLIDTEEFDSCLLQYNYLDRHNEQAIALAAERNMGVSIMGPIAGGRLSTPQTLLKEQAADQPMSPSELALRFVWSNPHVSVAVSGMNAAAQIDENISAANQAADLTENETALVRELVEKNQNLADLYCTGCAYCMPCPNDVNIPENFRFMNWSRVWGLEAEAKKGYASLDGKEHWSTYGSYSGLKAEACLQCGECEPKCPQNIPIIRQLEEVAAALG